MLSSAAFTTAVGNGSSLGAFGWTSNRSITQEKTSENFLSRQLAASVDAHRTHETRAANCGRRFLLRTQPHASNREPLRRRSGLHSKRIGCAGISVGGNLISYLTACVECTVAATPRCLMASISCRYPMTFGSLPRR